MNLVALIILLLFPATIMPSFAHPTAPLPSITSVNAYPKNNTCVLDIAGRFFGSKKPTAPYLWADFEQTKQPNNISLRPSWQIHSTAEIVSTLPSLQHSNSKKVLRFDVSKTSRAGIGITDIRHNEAPPTQLYVHAVKFYDFDIVRDIGPRGFNLKILRLWSTYSHKQKHLSRTNNAYIGFQGRHDLAARSYAEYTEKGKSARYSPSLQFTAQKWIQHELIYRPSTLNSQNGIFHLEENAHPMGTHRDLTTITNEYPAPYDRLYFDQVSNGTGEGPLYVYYDDIYIDTTWSRIILCNSPKLAFCTKKAIQLPLNWSNTHITVQLNANYINLEAQVWLFVFNKNNQNNKQGFPIPAAVNSCL